MIFRHSIFKIYIFNKLKNKDVRMLNFLCLQWHVYTKLREKVFTKFLLINFLQPLATSINEFIWQSRPDFFYWSLCNRRLLKPIQIWYEFVFERYKSKWCNTPTFVLVLCNFMILILSLRYCWYAEIKMMSLRIFLLAKRQGTQYHI